MMSVKENLMKQERVVRSEEYKLVEMLKEAFPVGETVQFWIRQEQSIPSTGDVVGYSYSGSQVSIRMDTPGKKVAGVHFKKILCV